jgi:hypothetical protein
VALLAAASLAAAACTGDASLSARLAELEGKVAAADA